MKNLFSTLTISLALASPTLAQPAPIDGYNDLSAAAAKVFRRQAGANASNQRPLTPDQVLQMKRASVKANEEALDQLRVALGEPTVVPPYGEAQATEDRARVFERAGVALSDEAAVRAADGDSAGAIDSLVTAMELGAVL
ncbi:hypothetical protein EON80_20435, partial [bacterium]